MQAPGNNMQVRLESLAIVYPPNPLGPIILLHSWPVDRRSFS